MYKDRPVIRREIKLSYLFNPLEEDLVYREFVLRHNRIPFADEIYNQYPVGNFRKAIEERKAHPELYGEDEDKNKSSN